jgi:hypothetical protein
VRTLRVSKAHCGRHEAAPTVLDAFDPAHPR